MPHGKQSSGMDLFTTVKWPGDKMAAILRGCDGFFGFAILRRTHTSSNPTNFVIY